MQQKSEFAFDELTMESEHELTRVIRYFTMPGPELWDNPDIVDEHVQKTSGDFRLFFVTEQYKTPHILVEFESGFVFRFDIYKIDVQTVEALGTFNQFIEDNLDQVCEFMLEHPLWMQA